ncbi:glycoside hydrolase [Dendrothele bispora CBS 962.96]|uniref:Glycoside hydrolase n=1 Tax=Dendrothele bispora (strain CBS 962.96) TaxID=1314807 RepID=A0A4S8MKG0_DENBC|nr:glycoside hydrolase [Dendrothele bispora CBS 962.96]
MGLYTWSPSIPDLARQLGFDPWPMLWGRNQIDEFTKTVTAGYANVVLGFNEPDQAGQSNLSPQDAAGLWKQYIQPLKSQGYKLVTPAVTSDPNAKQWMKDFFAACDGCTFDAQAVHWYDTSFDNFKSYINDYHNLFNLPIWVTEFAYQSFTGGAQGSLSQIQDFMGQATSYMESQDWVEFYCWFGAMHDMQNVNPLNQLMAGDGGLTDLGHQFISS